MYNCDIDDEQFFDEFFCNFSRATLHKFTCSNNATDIQKIVREIDVGWGRAKKCDWFCFKKKERIKYKMFTFFKFVFS